MANLAERDRARRRARGTSGRSHWSRRRRAAIAGATVLTASLVTPGEASAGSTPPAVVISITTDGVIGGETTVDASASTDDGAVVDIAIDSGDYDIGLRFGPVATFTYEAVDTYRVRVTVRDDDNMETTEYRDVEIKSPNGAVGRSFPLGLQPGPVDIDAAGQRLVVGQYGGRSVAVLDATTGTQIAVAELPAQSGVGGTTHVAAGPSGVLWAGALTSEDVERFYPYDSAIYRIDPATGSPLQTLSYAHGQFSALVADKAAPRAFAAADVYSADNECHSEVVRADANGLSAPILLSDCGVDLAYDPPHDRLVAVDQFLRAHVIDVASWTVAATDLDVAPPIMPTISGPAVAIDPVTSRWFVSSQAGYSVRTYDFDGTAAIPGPTNNGGNGHLAVDGTRGRFMTLGSAPFLLQRVDMSQVDILGSTSRFLTDPVFDPVTGNAWVTDSFNSRIVRFTENAPTSTVSVSIATIPPGDPAQVTVTGAITGTTQHGGSLSAVVPVGSSTAHVEGPPGWEVFDVLCDDTDSGPGTSPGDVAFSTDADEVVDCLVRLSPTTSDVAITKAVDQTTLLSGGDMQYTLTARNNGPGVATDVVMTDLLPGGVRYLGGGPGCTHNGLTAGGEVRCAVGDVEAGAVAIRTIDVRTLSTGVVSNRATVATASADSNAGNDISATVNSSVLPAVTNACQTGPGNELLATGTNAIGAVGVVTTGTLLSPTPVSLLRGVDEISARDGITLARLHSGVVCSWGDNYYSGLGRNSGPPIPGFGSSVSPRPSPVLLPNGQPLIAARVTAGSSNAFAIVDPDGDGAGQLVGWGDNTYGGVTPGVAGGEFNRAIAVALPGNPEVVDMDAQGYYHAAVTADGRIFTWGLNQISALGPFPPSPAAPARDLTPYLPLLAGERVVRVAILSHGMIVLTDRARGICWGDQSYCFNSTYGTFAPKLAFTAPGSVIGFDGSGRDGVALVVDDDGDGAGDVWSWGRLSGDGQMGNYSGQVFPLVRALVGEEVTQVSRNIQTLAIGVSGRVWGWGRGNSGMLGGNGLDGLTLTPLPLPWIEHADLVKAGGNRSFFRGDRIPDLGTAEVKDFGNIPVGTTVSTDSEGDGATSADRIETTIRTSRYGWAGNPLRPTIRTVANEAPLDPDLAQHISGYQLMSEMVTLSSVDPAPANDPHVVTFSLYLTASQRAQAAFGGGVVSDMKVIRNGVVVPDCSTPSPPHPEDPCVRSRVFNNTTGNADVTVATTRFSTWTFAVPTPVADAGGPYAAVEGTPLQLAGQLTGIEGDPDATIAWTAEGGDFDDPSRPDATFTALDEGTVVADLSATAADATATDRTEIVVTNAAPIIDAVTLPGTASVGVPVDLAATFRDAGVLDAHTVTVDWGDGSPLSTAAIDAGVGAATVPHTFSTPGTRTVRIDLRDDDGGATSETRTIVVAPTVTPTGLVVTVVGPLGPVRAARVRVFAVGAVGPRAVASTSTDGTATFDTLPVGSYQIEVRPSGGRLRRAWYGGPDRTSATVVTGGEQQIAVTLEARP